MVNRFVIDKVKRLEKLSKGAQGDLLGDLLAAFEIIHDRQESVAFIQDLFTRKEIAFLSKRLRIAKLLLEKKTYEEVVKGVHVSHATIAKVASWLSQKGEGFRMVIQKLPKKSEHGDDSLVKAEWKRLMRRYPGRFLPELLFDEIGKKLDKDKQRELSTILDTLDTKRLVDQETERLHSEQYKLNRKKTLLLRSTKV